MEMQMSKHGFKCGFAKYLSERKTRKLAEAEVLSGILENNTTNKFSIFLHSTTEIDIDGMLDSLLNVSDSDTIRESLVELIDMGAHMYMSESKDNDAVTRAQRDELVGAYIEELELRNGVNCE